MNRAPNDVLTRFASAAAVIVIVIGCNYSQSPAPMTTSKIEFPFQHPAAKEANRIFLTLEVYSESDYRNLSRRDRYIWDVSWFETEVMNGGVDQYFYNSTGDHALECLEALRAIKAENSYHLLKQGCDLFPSGKPSPNVEVRRKQLESLRDVKREPYIDDLIDGEIEVDLYQLLLDYYRDADAEAK